MKLLVTGNIGYITAEFIEEAPVQEMHFLALSDLGDLLYKIFDNWGEGINLILRDWRTVIKMGENRRNCFGF